MSERGSGLDFKRVSAHRAGLWIRCLQETRGRGIVTRKVHSALRCRFEVFVLSACQTWAGQDVLKILQCREVEKLFTVLVGMILIILI